MFVHNELILGGYLLSNEVDGNYSGSIHPISVLHEFQKDILDTFDRKCLKYLFEIHEELKSGELNQNSCHQLHLTKDIHPKSTHCVQAQLGVVVQ